MKSIFMKVSIALVLVSVVTLTKPDSVHAKQLKDGTTYSVDLNNDGRREKVRYNFVEENSDYGIPYGTTYVYINNKCTVKLKGRYSRINVVNIDKRDRYKEIYAQNISYDNACAGAIAYRYKGGKLKKCFKLSSRDCSIRVNLLDPQTGDGKVYFESEYADSTLGQGYVKQAFKIINGKLKAVKKSVFYTTKEWRVKKYKANMNLSVYSKIGSRKQKFTLYSGTVFHVLRIKPRNYKDIDAWSNSIPYIYIRTDGGKQGWIRNPGVDFYQSYYNGEYMNYKYGWA